MKIVHAIWEKRNLGVDCNEITIEADDALDHILDGVKNNTVQYMVIKVPAGRTDVMSLLEDMGYRFIECSLHITHDLKSHETHVLGVRKRMAESVDYSLMDDNDLEQMYAEIHKGIFKHDRISLDPFFTSEQAANRYVGWISDELARGAEAYKVTYKDSPVGFFVYKYLGNGIYYPFIAGLYDKQLNSGLGAGVFLTYIHETKKRNGKMVSAYVSTNNQAALKADLSIGYEIKAVSYVYIKHN